ncbi:hypothetical protein [Deinococcus cellulosilyticus]|uniref:Uncharacterized protein n=1 Tax=Deinococcus cellulosilyticus (strain DSM 18568 / NBRC 106333 / KACC 11606 / 5516J-15) TaxID=1223518 RepID=A0A511N1M2_DEIC1|nr:hypothetical protein [Deinococcus cellulosilyticus]GEM46397.1 hypothetical protein DC3_20320 [Deinococcus cellulosilyticus NBRC 106333 = KACC 11606]
MSRFANLKKIIESPEAEPEVTLEAAQTPAAPEPVLAEPAPASSIPAAEPRRKRGRPEGKRSDPTFTGTTFYVEKSVLLDAQVKLLQEGKTRDVSEVVNGLLKLWTAGKVKL